MTKALRTLILPFIALFSVVGAASAQSFTERPIRVIIGSTPGTILDAIARPVTIEMSKRLGQPIIIEFKPGANATIAAKTVVSAEPDGYTLLFGTSNTIHPLMNRNNAVDAGKDMTSISSVASAPFFVLSRSSLPVTGLQDLAAYARANPGKLTYGANSATADLLMALLKARTGIDARGILYKSSAQSSVALISGEVDLAAATVQAYLPLIQAGKVRPLFVMAGKRSPLLPNVPTTSELGIQNVERATNMGFWGPPGMPKAIVQKLVDAVQAALAVPAVADFIQRQAAAEVIGSTPEGQLQIFESETRGWAEAAKLANYQAP